MFKELLAFPENDKNPKIIPEAESLMGDEALKLAYKYAKESMYDFLEETKQEPTEELRERAVEDLRDDMHSFRMLLEDPKTFVGTRPAVELNPPLVAADRILQLCISSTRETVAELESMLESPAGYDASTLDELFKYQEEAKRKLSIYEKSLKYLDTLRKQDKGESIFGAN